MEGATPPPRAAVHVARLRRRVDTALRDVVPVQEPAALYEPVRYVLSGRGKRVRPVLLMLAAETFGADAEKALPAALAVEVFHNFTLVHDDIMDHADERRGRPTVHVRWSEATALLAGDYLLARAYELLGRLEQAPLAAVLDVFSRMVARLCEGQTLDKAFESRLDVRVAEYLQMIDSKTGALLEACLELGGLVGGASAEARQTLRAVGRHVGRAFQIQDDLLDLVAEDGRWGKPIGGDLMEGKRTFLLLRSLERTQDGEQSWFTRILTEGGLSAEAVPEARSRMQRLGVLDEAADAVERHTRSAVDALDRLPMGPAVETLKWLVQRMQVRAH